MSVGVIPETWIAGASCFGISTGLSSALLWKPFKQMQDRSAPKKVQRNDFEGIEFNLETDISRTQSGSYRYSGIDWKVEPNNPEIIDKGERVVVVTATVGLLSVKKVT